MDDYNIFDYNYELGLDREEPKDKETDSITGVARESGLSSTSHAGGTGGIPRPRRP